MLITAYCADYLNPQYFWIFAFFGLAYPILLTINFLFIIFWIWRRKWNFILSLAVIISGWSYIGRYLQIRLFQKENINMPDVRVMSYNVRLFNYYKWEKSDEVRTRILDFVNNESPDIITFQDFVTLAKNSTQSEEYTDSMLASYPWKQVLYTLKSGDGLKYGVATYSRYPIVRRGSIRFFNSYNSCIYSDVVVNSDTLRIYNVHLQSIKFRKNYYYFTDSLAAHLNAKRIDEMRDISDHLKVAFIKRAQQVDELELNIRRSPYPVIVCGDFNDTPVSYTYRQIREDKKDAFLGSGNGFGNTYRGNFPSFRIDYIFHSASLTSVQYKTHRVTFSDHFPVSCGLILNE
jgi:endonuclease/exonuclease/phosphatase family metal-dependent hydrolase